MLRHLIRLTNDSSGKSLGEWEFGEVREHFFKHFKPSRFGDLQQAANEAWDKAIEDMQAESVKVTGTSA